MSTSTVLLSASAVLGKLSACPYSASLVSSATAINACSPWSCAAGSHSAHGKAVSTTSSRVGCGRRCWRSSTAIPACAALLVRCGPERSKRCPGVVASLREGGDELLTFFTFPKAQWKTLRTTNTIERLHEEFRRRVKTQGSLPSEDAAVVLLFSLVASGQIRLRRIDGWQKIATVLRQQTPRAA